MPEVDARGRITIPKHLREELDLSPGTHVEVDRQEGKIVVERERSPEDIVTRLREPAEADRQQEIDETDPHARRHRENVRSHAERSDE